MERRNARLMLTRVWFAFLAVSLLTACQAPVDTAPQDEEPAEVTSKYVAGSERYTVAVATDWAVPLDFNRCSTV